MTMWLILFVHFVPIIVDVYGEERQAELVQAIELRLPAYHTQVRPTTAIIEICSDNVEGPPAQATKLDVTISSFDLLFVG